MYSVLTIVNNTVSYIYLKVTKGVNLKNPHHKKKNVNSIKIFMSIVPQIKNYIEIFDISYFMN